MVPFISAGKKRGGGGDQIFQRVTDFFRKYWLVPPDHLVGPGGPFLGGLIVGLFH